MNTERELIESIKVNIQLKQLEVNSHLINYAISGEGPPLLLIHGGNIGWGQWYPNIPELAKHFKVYAIDLPGAGRSSRINYAFLDLEKDLVDLVDRFIKILGLGKISILGSSIGGWISLKIALRCGPDLDKLILTNCVGFTDFVRTSDKIIGIYPLAFILSKTILKPYRSNKNIEKFLRDVFYNKNLDLKREFIDYFYETMRTSHNLLFISRLSSFFGMRKEFFLRNDLPKVKNKTLIIWGNKDKLMPVDRNQENFSLIPNSEVRVIRDAGHIPSIEKSSEFNKLVIDFLRS